MARPASSGDVKSIENKNAALKKSVEEKTKQGKETLKALSGEVVKISEKANEKGHLFSKVSLDDVFKAIVEQTGVQIEKTWIKNFDQIKSVGEFKINLEAFGEKSFILLDVGNR
jgi:large subunit ribosomal protein L9